MNILLLFSLYFAVQFACTIFLVSFNQISNPDYSEGTDVLRIGYPTLGHIKVRVDRYVIDRQTNPYQSA
jgi:hypothetical protein